MPEVRKALRTLEELGYISTDKRENTTHIYRLCPDKFVMKNWNISSHSHVDIAGGGNTRLPKDIITKNVKTKKESKDFAGEPATPSTNKIQETIGEDKDKTSYPMKTNTPANVPALEKILRTRIPELFPTQTYLAPFTGKEYGQLSNYIDKLGDNDPVKVINAVLSNWDDFRWFIDNLNSHGSYQNLPSIPCISTIATHVSQTVNFMNYLEKEEAGKLTALKICEAREQKAAIEKTTKESALLKARENMTEEERNIEKYSFHYDKIRRNEFIKSMDEPLSPDIGKSDYDPDIILKERCSKAFAQLLSEGSLFLEGLGIISLDSQEVKEVSI